MLRIAAESLVVASTLWFLAYRKLECPDCAYLTCLSGIVFGWVLMVAFHLLTGVDQTDVVAVWVALGTGLELLIVGCLCKH